ncbi:MAG: UvrD-helicase domain-containing protein [Rhodanobacteraceae bacterium]
MSSIKVAISQDFLTAFTDIPKAQQKKVQAFVSKFRSNPQAPSINYESIQDAASPDYRSVRIDQAYRGIVLKPEHGDVYLLLWVARHDSAYDWARRHTCQINPATGSLQLYQVQTEPEQITVRKPVVTVADTPLFSVRDRELTRLGVPAERLAQVKALTSMAELDRLAPKLPVEAHEALSFLADGIPLDEVMDEYALPDGPAAVDTSDVPAALQRAHSQRRFHVVEDDQELQQMLEAPLEQWRVFLHPTQRRLVERDWSGPVRVLGGAGTGKTVVAMHRARWLVRNRLKPDERLLFTTFTRNLAMDIEANLRSLCSAQEMKQVTVVNIDAWVKGFLAREGQPARIVYPGQDALDKCWDRAMQVADGSLGLSDEFIREEWQQVVLPQRILDRAAYFAAGRKGRGTPLTRKQRALLWPVFEEARFQLHQAGLLTSEDAMYLAMDLLNSGEAKQQFRTAVVDEAQDLGPEALRLIRALVPEDTNDLLIVGDGHQRIYARTTSLGSCGINIRGRGHKLRINYRTTDQIRKLATAILEDVPIDDLDGEADSQAGYRSLVEGVEPTLKGFDSSEEEATWVVEEIQRSHSEGMPLREICVVARTKTQLKPTEAALQAAGVKVVAVSREAADDATRSGVRVANMHRIKGLEFRIVFIVAVQDGVVPLDYAMNSASDPVERRRREINERALLHVAATRAIRTLTISWSGTPSRFVDQ